MSNYSFSQNFLFNKELVESLVKKANFSYEDTVIDIGSGSGIIADSLKSKVKKVIAFEIDEKFKKILREKFKNNENIEVLGEDFLNFNLKNLKNPLNTFSNIPYNQTSKICKKILIDTDDFQKVYLIMQKQSAERLLGLREGLLLSLLIFNKFEANIAYEFKYSDFKPVSRVKSVLISFKKRERNLVLKEDEKLFKDFIAFIIMQQKPEIIQRLEKLISPRASIEILKVTGINIHSSLYEIPKEKFIEMFYNFKLNLKPFHYKVNNSYLQYEKINQANVKNYRTRSAPKNEVPRSHNQRSRRNP